MTRAELVPWLREQIAAEGKMAEEVIDTWAVVSGYPSIRTAVLHFANRDAVVARCQAHTAILDLVDMVYDDEGDPIHLGGYGEAWWDVVTRMGLMYHRFPGYRDEWRPE